MNDNYRPLAKYYDLLSSCYSLGRIRYCREAYLKEIADAVNEFAELKVCFVGVGHGSEAIKAAEAGAFVTVVDSSRSMLDAFEKNMSLLSVEVSSRIKVVHADVREFSNQRKYSFDWVVANFFLNVFEQGEVRKVLEHILSCCSKKGFLVISDFYLSRGESEDSDTDIFLRFVSCIQKVYWYVALVIFRIWVKNAFHRVYHYEDLLSQVGWEVIEKKRFGFLSIKFYHSIRCQMINE